MARGILPLAGFCAALEAIAALAVARRQTAPPAPPRAADKTRLVAEPEAKQRLARAGLCVPEGRVMAAADVGEHGLSWPVVVKSVGAAHKSETGGVSLNISCPNALRRAAQAMPGDSVLVETMCQGGVAEVLIGVVADPAHGLVLSLGWGGTETELHQDVVHDLLPVTRARVFDLLGQLRLAPRLAGYRGAPAADVPAIVSAVLAVQDYVLANPAVLELEINPLLCLPHGCVAVDALIREACE